MVMAHKGAWQLLALVYVVLGLDTSAAQIFIGDDNAPGILYAPLPDPRDDTNIMDTRFTLISLQDDTQFSGIDYDPENEMVYWNDFVNNRISRIKLDGTNRQQIITTTSPTSIALDLVNRKIYWTIYNGASRGVSRADLNGNLVEELVVYTNFVQPTPILVDPVNEYLLWSTRIVNQVIKANLDGTNPTVVKEMYAVSLVTEQCGDGTTRLFYLTSENTLGVMNSLVAGSEGETLGVLPGRAITSSLNKYGSKLISSLSGTDLASSGKGTIYEYDLRTSAVTVHNSTVTLTNGNTLTTNPTVIRIASEGTETDPVVIDGCPDSTTVTLDDSDTSNVSSVSWTEPVLNSWSSCPTLEFSGPGTNGGNFSSGTVELSYMATDAAGNRDVCNFSVSVGRSGDLTSTTSDPQSGNSNTISSFSPVLPSLIIAILIVLI